MSAISSFRKILTSLVSLVFSLLIGAMIGQALFNKNLWHLSFGHGVEPHCLNIEHFMSDLGLDPTTALVNDTVERIDIIPERGKKASEEFERQVYQNFFQSNPRSRLWYKGTSLPVVYKSGAFYQPDCRSLYYGEIPMLIVGATTNRLMLSHIESLSFSGFVPSYQVSMVFEKPELGEAGILRFRQRMNYTSHYTYPVPGEKLFSETHLIQIVKKISLVDSSSTTPSEPPQKSEGPPGMVSKSNPSQVGHPPVGEFSDKIPSNGLEL